MLFQTYISPLSKIKSYKHSKCLYISLTSKKLTDDICKYLRISHGKKSDKISMPLIKDSLKRHYVRGLIDSDGSISDITKGRDGFPKCSIASKSIKLKSQINTLCRKKNINCVFDNISIIWNGVNALKFLNYCYKNACVSLTRKRCLYKMCTTWRPQKGSLFRPRKSRKDKGII